VTGRTGRVTSALTSTEAKPPKNANSLTLKQNITLLCRLREFYGAHKNAAASCRGIPNHPNFRRFSGSGSI
jgi:hypothetical protein